MHVRSWAGLWYYAYDVILPLLRDNPLYQPPLVLVAASGFAPRELGVPRHRLLGPGGNDWNIVRRTARLAWPVDIKLSVNVEISNPKLRIASVSDERTSY